MSNQIHLFYVIKWKPVPRYHPFVREIHRSTVDSPQRPVTRNFDVFFDLLEQMVGQTIETPLIWDAISLIMTSL